MRKSRLFSAMCSFILRGRNLVLRKIGRVSFRISLLTNIRLGKKGSHFGDVLLLACLCKNAFLCRFGMSSSKAFSQMRRRSSGGSCMIEQRAGVGFEDMVFACATKMGRDDSLTLVLEGICGEGYPKAVMVNLTPVRKRLRCSCEI